MPKEQCDHLLPEGGPRAPHSPCLLRQGHDGPHLIEDEGRYWEWEYDGEDCECTDESLLNEMCTCFVYERVDSVRAQQRIKVEGPTI